MELELVELPGWVVSLFPQPARAKPVASVSVAAKWARVMRFIRAVPSINA
jgi:hypothetical protein